MSDHKNVQGAIFKEKGCLTGQKGAPSHMAHTCFAPHNGNKLQVPPAAQQLEESEPSAFVKLSCLTGQKGVPAHTAHTRFTFHCGSQLKVPPAAQQLGQSAKASETKHAVEAVTLALLLLLCHRSFCYPLSEPV